jgi:magnesium chelatase subunit I
VYAHASDLCIAANVDGLRADLVILRAARALAALHGDQEISIAHLDAVAELALHHRRQTPPRAHSSTPAPATALPKTTPPSTTLPTTTPYEKNARDSTALNSDNGSADSAQENPWGEMPPQPVEVIAVKGVKPLPLKKY